MEKRFYTAESVTEGHPDKICDQISDAILDELIKKDPNSRVACETCVTTGLVLVMGEITTTAYIDIPGVVRNTIKEIGYTDSTLGFDGNTCAVVTALDEQSPDIAMGVMLLPSDIWWERKKYGINVESDIYDNPSWRYDTDIFYSTNPLISEEEINRIEKRIKLIYACTKKISYNRTFAI